jgi:hypothetical protein
MTVFIRPCCDPVICFSPRKTLTSCGHAAKLAEVLGLLGLRLKCLDCLWFHGP